MRLPSRIPHLIKADSDLLLQFLNSNDFNYAFLHYDVPVGEGRDPGSEFDLSIRRMATDLSRRRIDCVAQASNVIHVIEVTQSAGLTALGQLYAYPLLYWKTYHPDLQIVPVLLTRSLQTDMTEAITLVDGHVIVLPE